MKICHFLSSNSLNLLVENFLCPIKICLPTVNIMPALLQNSFACQLSCSLHGTSFFIVPKHKCRLGLHFKQWMLPVTNHGFGESSVTHSSHCRTVPPFQNVSLKSVVATQSLTIRQLALGLWLPGLLVLFHSSHLFSWSIPLHALPPPPMQTILQCKDSLHALCW